MNEETSPSLTQAEQAVNNSLANFESAVERLSDKVESGIVPLVRHVRTHPRPYLTAGALLGAGLVYFYTVAKKSAPN